MGEPVDELVRARLSWLSATVRSWYDAERLASQLAAELSIEASRVGDAEFGTSFRDAVADPRLPSDPLAWANRRLEFAEGGWAVCGIRFRALDRDRPFVDVVAADQAPTPDGLAAVAAGVLPEFAAFQPLSLRVDVPSPDEMVAALNGDRRVERSEVDQYVVAGPVAWLLERGPAAGGVSLQPGEPGRLAARVAEIYAGNSEESFLWAAPEDEESLAECASQGLLFEVLVDGTPAGAVAAIREDGHGLSGFCVQELCLDSSFRGRGLAARVVHLLVRELPAGPGDVLWGTIHPDNQPSVRQALSLGREIVGGYVWVTPRGLPGMPASSIG